MAEPKLMYPALIVQRLRSSLWRVKGSGGEKLLDFPGKAAAVRFATSWAKTYSLAEVLVYNMDAELEQIIPPHTRVWSTLPRRTIAVRQEEARAVSLCSRGYSDRQSGRSRQSLSCPTASRESDLLYRFSKPPRGKSLRYPVTGAKP